MTKKYRINFTSREWDHSGVSKKLYKFVTQNCFAELADEYQTDIDYIAEFVKDNESGRQLLIDFLSKKDFIVEKWQLIFDNGHVCMSGIEFYESLGLTAFLLEYGSSDNDDDDGMVI